MGALRAASGENEPSSPTLGKLAMNRKVRGKERQTRKKAAFGGHKPSGLDTLTPGSLPLETGSFVWNCPFPFHFEIPRCFPL
ncbi:hypothetical protein ACFX13_007079 [Malus domestica]